MYYKFLNKHKESVQSVFLNDITDVTVVKNPFEQTLFKTNPNSIFCGDEQKILANEWMFNHCKTLREKITNFAMYEDEFKSHTLLNCGIIGGNTPIMLKLLKELCYIHKTYNQNNKSAYTGDMGVFNYAVRSNFNLNLFHGEPVNTVFKKYETNRKDCWFIHK